MVIKMTKTVATVIQAVSPLLGTGVAAGASAAGAAAAAAAGAAAGAETADVAESANAGVVQAIPTHIPSPSNSDTNTFFMMIFFLGMI